MALIKLMVEGGDMKPGPAVAQQLGPMGINIGKVISDINAATKEFKGMTVPVNLDVDGKTKTYIVKVLSPSVASLIKKELSIESGSGARKKSVVGNISMEQIIGIAKTKHSSMLAKEFLAAVTSVVGSCMSLGILIDSKDPKEVIQDIKDGKYDKEIKQQITQPSAEKKKELVDFFNTVKNQQEVAKKKEEEEKAAAEAAKAAAATTTAPAAGAAATPVTAAAKTEAKPAAAKPAAKK